MTPTGSPSGPSGAGVADTRYVSRQVWVVVATVAVLVAGGAGLAAALSRTPEQADLGGVVVITPAPEPAEEPTSPPEPTDGSSPGESPTPTSTPSPSGGVPVEPDEPVDDDGTHGPDDDPDDDPDDGPDDDEPDDDD